MTFRVMDEPVVFEGRGLALFVNEDNGCRFVDGCRIVDVFGREHVVERVTLQEDITCLFLRGGDAEYFGRLFRNVLVDATLFTLAEEAR